MKLHLSRTLAAAACGLLVSISSGQARAAGGYFVLGYGPMAHQSAGTSTAIGLDAFAGASNPAKLTATETRLDLGVLLFMPYRRIERTGSNTAYDFATTSRNDLFVLPEVGYARRLNERLTLGVSVFGNGGLNTEYPGSTGVPGSNANPGRCGNRPGNFFMGCGKLGFDLSQVIVAPTLSLKLAPGHSIGVSPLLSYQRISVYGLQAFEAVSTDPSALSNRGHDGAFGAGVRVGWFGRILPSLDLGAAYSSPIYMQRFDAYRGLLADHGAFDIPQNFSVGLAYRPVADWTLGLDVQRIYFGEIEALSNGVLNSLRDPVNSGLGSPNGTGFNWRNQTNYRGALAWAPTPSLTLRAGFAWGRRPQADAGMDSVSFNMLAPNPIRNVTGGFTWAWTAKDALNFAYGRYLRGQYHGPSATAALGVGGDESIDAYVDTVMLGWSRRF